MRTPPEHILKALQTAASLNQIIVIELVQDGVKLYANGMSIFGPAPTPDPLVAHNYAGDLFNDFRVLWQDAGCVYVKGAGGGKSSLRSDVPAQIVIFNRPVPQEAGRLAIG